jgi:hypothetical protein
MDKNTRQQKMSHIANDIRDALNNVVDGKYNTHSVKAAADGLIELRKMFTDRHGNIDMLGNSYSYRQAVAEIMTMAGVRQQERPKIMATIRYHVGNLLREKFTEAELAAFGLMATSPLERAKKDRKDRSRVLRSATNQEGMMTDPDEIVTALKSAVNLLNNVDFEAFTDLDAAMANVLLDHLAKRTAELRSSLK